MPSSRNLPNPGVELVLSLISPALASWFFTTSTIWEVHTQGKGTKTVLVLQGVGVSEASADLRLPHCFLHHSLTCSKLLISPFYLTF